MRGLRRPQLVAGLTIDERTTRLGERSRALAEGIVQELALWFSRLPHRLDRFLDPAQLQLWEMALSEHFQVAGLLECHFGQKGRIEVIETHGEPNLEIVCEVRDSSVFLPEAGGAQAYPARTFELHLVVAPDLERVLRAWVREAA